MTLGIIIKNLPEFFRVVDCWFHPTSAQPDEHNEHPDKQRDADRHRHDGRHHGWLAHRENRLSSSGSNWLQLSLTLHNFIFSEF